MASSHRGCNPARLLALPGVVDPNRAERRRIQAQKRQWRRALMIVAVAVLLGGGLGSGLALGFTSRGGSTHAQAEASRTSSSRPTETTTRARPTTTTRTTTTTTASTTRPAVPTTTTSHRTTQTVWIDEHQLDRLVASAGSRYGAGVGAAVRNLADGRLVETGNLVVGPAWSTLKVPLVMARVRLAESSHESVSDMTAIREAATSAITQSDNYSAARLFDALENRTGGLLPASHYIQSQLALGLATRTQVTTAPPPSGAFSTWGQTQWSLDEGTTYFRQLARHCVPTPAGTRLVLSLMQQIVPGQRWGIGSVSWPGASLVAFKGGWGPIPAPYLVRQFGIVETSAGRGVVVGLIAHAGSFEQGQAVLDGLASAVEHSVRLSALGSTPLCG
jgi:hypothetical protein